MTLPPKEYFEDDLTLGVAKGAVYHMMNNRFTLLKLPVGYGKTIISMQVARVLSKLNNDSMQLMIMAPKAKRLDKSFNEAIEATCKYYNIDLPLVQINNQDIGTFAGLNTMKNKKPELYAEFLTKLKSNNTLLILDETHMQLRDSTNTANRNFREIFKEVEKTNYKFKILGLTATPFDKSILDTVGYLVLNGHYRSRNDFYKREIVGFRQAYQNGLTLNDINNMIVDKQFKIHGNMFIDKHRVINKLKLMIYAPTPPRNFHIPKNEFKDLPVVLSKEGQEDLAFIMKMDRQKAYTDNTTKTVDYVKTLTTDENVLEKVFKICNDKRYNQPLIFYRYDVTLKALVDYCQKHNLKYFEVNGHSSSYFANNDNISPVFVQYQSGATAFESKASNVSIYLDLPTSDIAYQQSLGRNTRRGQDVDVVTNYIVRPQVLKGGQPKLVKYSQDQYNKIVSKNKWNAIFEGVFETEWGKFNEIFVKKG